MGPAGVNVSPDGVGPRLARGEGVVEDTSLRGAARRWNTLENQRVIRMQSLSDAGETGFPNCSLGFREARRPPNTDALSC
jgi:hypothetical protein